MPATALGAFVLSVLAVLAIQCRFAQGGLDGGDSAVQSAWPCARLGARPLGVVDRPRPRVGGGDAPPGFEPHVHPRPRRSQVRLCWGS